MRNQFINNPEGFGGHAHSASITEYNGVLYATWYAYQEKEFEKGQIAFSRFNDSTQTWNNSQFAFPETKNESCGNPVIFSDENGLHLYFVKLMGGYWDTAQIFYSHFNEKDSSWGSPRKVNTGEGVMVRHRPMKLGMSLIHPAYDEKTMKTILFESRQDYTSWKEYSKIDGEYIQGDLIAFNEYEVQLYLRAAGDHTKVIKAMSSNGGKEWPVVRETVLPCPLSGIAAIKLDTGEVLICNNHTEAHKRSPISLNLSESKGVLFEKGPFHLDESMFELSYPSLLQTQDGQIHIVFTYNREKIKYLSFEKEELFKKMEDLND